MGFSEISEAFKYTLSEEGACWVYRKSKDNIIRRIREKCDGLRYSSEANNSYIDVLFINGCDYSVPHPIRYRVWHQMEQLRAAGLSAQCVDANRLSFDDLRHARSFVFFRCPITELVSDFIEKAHALNKRVYFDIDDLVIDAKYTDDIPFVASMSDSDKSLYDDGVRRMGETLRKCDAAITTTETLAEELGRYVPAVYINRNVASDQMLMLSQEAVYRRDDLPRKQLKDIPVCERKKWRLSVERLRKKKESNEILIGYFSGSITHNADFEMILPAIAEVMKRRSSVKLLLMGEISIPAALKDFAGRIQFSPFCDWKRLPNVISRCDINLAPLEDTLFNRAKSENKWIEASLVKVPTIASKVGAFDRMISDGETGILCSTPEEWLDALLSLVDSEERRISLGNNAFRFCKEHCITVRTAANIAKIIRDNQCPNFAMVLPSLNISGGVLVALKHTAYMQDAGYDVVLVNTDNSHQWFEFEGHDIPVLNRVVQNGHLDDCPLEAQIDTGVATLWDTLDFLRRYPRVNDIFYMVQNLETDFYLPGNVLRFAANSTYLDSSRVHYATISKWCERWLRDVYGKNSRFVSNGIDVDQFYPIERDFKVDKIRILIEGDCGSEYKNVDESFYITNQLDPDKYEIWYMCYTGKTKDFYRIDNNLGRVPHEKVAEIYRQCHILLKSSLLESFSYPPLEMMSTGGYVVVAPNEGNVEFLRDGENCLLYEQGNYSSAIEAIERIVSDPALRTKLYEGGVETAQSRDWRNLAESIVRLYETR